MKNSILCCVASLVLALSVVGTTCTVNAEPLGFAKVMGIKDTQSEWNNKLDLIKSCFKSENSGKDRLYRISGEKLVDYLGAHQGQFFQTKGEQNRFAKLKSLMYKAHGLEMLNSDSNEKSRRLANEVLEFYNKEGKPLFECSYAYKHKFKNALREMVENPYGAKRLISLMLLRMIGNNDTSPFACGFDRPIKIIAAKKGEKCAFLRDLRWRHQNGVVTEITKKELSIKLSFLEKIKDAGGSSLMHELTHFYHFLLLGEMPDDKDSLTKMASDDKFSLTKRLFPTRYMDNNHTFGKFSDTIFNAIGNKKINKAILGKLLDDLRTPAKKKGKDNSEVLPITKEKYGYYKKKLSNATGNPLKRITADLIAEYAFSYNYWVNQEEMLTIFGLVPTVVNGKHDIVIDRDNGSAFDEKSRLEHKKGNIKWIWFAHETTYFSENVSPQARYVLNSLGISGTYAKTVNDYQKTAAAKVESMFDKGDECSNALYPEQGKKLQAPKLLANKKPLVKQKKLILKPWQILKLKQQQLAKQKWLKQAKA